MRPVLDPASPLWRRDTEHLQVGSDPSDAVVLRDVPGVLDLLRRCDGVRDADDVLRTAPSDQQQALASALDALLDAGVLVDADSSWRLGAAAGEAARLTGAGVVGSRAPLAVADRRRRRIGLAGSGLLTDPLAALLASCGASCSPGRASGVDLVVLAGYPEPDRHLADACARDNIPHVVISLHARSAVLGPVVLPGRTACLRCADETRADTDPAWAALVPQLDQPLHRPVAAFAAASPVLVATLVAATAATVLAMLDDLPPAYGGGIVRWAAACGPPSVQPLPPHPRCGCMQLR